MRLYIECIHEVSYLKALIRNQVHPMDRRFTQPTPLRLLHRALMPGVGRPPKADIRRLADCAVTGIGGAGAPRSEGAGAEGRAGLRRHPQRAAAARQHVPDCASAPPRLPSGSPTCTRTSCGTPRPAWRSRRRRRQGRPADARARLRHHDPGHLRPPLRGPPRRGRRRHGPRAEPPLTPAGSGRVCCPVLPQCCPSPISAGNARSGPDQRFRWSGPLFRVVPPTGFEPALPP